MLAANPCPGRPRRPPRLASLASWLTLLTTLLASAGCGRPPPPVRHAQGLLRQADYAGAEAAADRAFGQHPDHPALWRVKIQAAFGRGEAGRALGLYQDWQRRRGGHDPALLGRLAMTTLWQGLRVPSAQVRARTIQVIERLELEPLARDVAERLADDSDLVAGAAAVALLRSHPGAPRVATQILQSDDAAARALVVEGIGRKIGAAARAELMPALDDPHPAVRRAAAQALGIAGEDLAARLAHMARNDQDGPVRATALRVLGREAGDNRRVVTLAHQTALKALDDTYPGARLAAIGVLARADDTESLRRIAASAEDVAMAVQAAAALGDAAVLDQAVRRALADPTPALRQTGIDALHTLPDRALAVRLATTGLDDQSWRVRLAAARALLYLGEQARAVEALARALDLAGERERVDAAADLMRAGDPRGAEALAVLGKSTNPNIREAVVRAHAQPRRDVAGERITAALAQALADPSPLVRLLAAETVLITGERRD